MKDLLHDDRAYGNMSFVIVVILLALLLAGGMSNILTKGVNVVIEVNNDNVANNMSSQQTSENLEFSKNTFKMISFLTILGVLVWAKMHSTQENTTVDATLLFGSVIVMYFMCFISMIMVLSFGMTLDVFFIAIGDTGLNETLNGTVWQGTNDTPMAVSIVYFICQLPCFVGILAFFMNAVRRTQGEQVEDIGSYQLTGED
ncbi:MAG: hypothetical protein WC415_06085 [Patescibacteria group bacterium]|jgi:hypothetical protein